MTNTDWVYEETVQKRIRIQKIDKQNRNIDAFDLDLGYPLNFNVDQQVDLEKIKKAKIYQATVKIYKAEFTEELLRQMVESALDNPIELQKIQAFKNSGAKPTRLDLIELKH
ncbi:MAG: hypothetical protein ACQCN3_05600 [Candidatus Bathyarchaeia archaeon]|jgi:hypothetical protein